MPCVDDGAYLDKSAYWAKMEEGPRQNQTIGQTKLTTALSAWMGV